MRRLSFLAAMPAALAGALSFPQTLFAGDLAAFTEELETPFALAVTQDDTDLPTERPDSGTALAAAAGQTDAKALAKELANPVASLISVPLQFNWDDGFGPEGASRTALNIQPVFPFQLNEDWNLISRTIIPLVSQEGFAPGIPDKAGLSDVLQSFFFSPVQPTSGGMIWGVGPVFLLPTATDDLLGAKKWGAGVTGVALKQTGPWTYGGLANHVWSIAGDEDRPDISATYLQPFVSYTLPSATSFVLNSESVYDWESEQWSVPVNAIVTRVFTVGKRPISLGAGVRYWAENPEPAADDWGLRFNITFLFPK